jgi:hypothetical protein
VDRNDKDDRRNEAHIYIYTYSNKYEHKYGGIYLASS